VSDNTTHGDPIALIRDTSSIVGGQALGAATSLVDFRSHGHCLIVGETEQALSLIPKLTPLSITVLTIDPALARPEKKQTDTGVTVFCAPAPQIQGYLGAFQVQVMDAGRLHDLAVMSMTETGSFDLILDLSSQPLIASLLLPLGYYHGNTDSALHDALNELPEMVGDFDKPRYFDYDPTRCAHSRSSLKGCSRCIDVCAADAIQTQGDEVVVNPFMCQGCGSCATVCPSGAMTYAWPRPTDAIARTREMYDNATTPITSLLLYRQSEDEQADSAFETSLPAHVIAVAVEEVTAYGIDYWASMLAAGFQQIVLGVAEALDTDAGSFLLRQIDFLERVLQGLGYEHPTAVVALPIRISEQDDKQQAALTAVLDKSATLTPRKEVSARFATQNDKRHTFRMAIDQLAASQWTSDGASEAVVDLPDSNPFGQVQVNRQDCTLCMACVSVCPAGALLDGQELPKLRFIESNCVQCGMCEKACPENVISLDSRFVVDSVAARATTTLNEEQPFHCVQCHKAFATQKMITGMMSKLAGHWMFSDEKALHRLRMCEDCRVKDIFMNEQQGIAVHKED